MKDLTKHELPAPKIVDRGTFHAELDALLDHESRRGRDGYQLSVARPDRLRAPGKVGGLAGGLATTVHLHSD